MLDFWFQAGLSTGPGYALNFAGNRGGRNAGIGLLFRLDMATDEGRSLGENPVVQSEQGKLQAITDAGLVVNGA